MVVTCLQDMLVQKGKILCFCRFSLYVCLRVYVWRSLCFLFVCISIYFCFIFIHLSIFTCLFVFLTERERGPGVGRLGRWGESGRRIVTRIYCIVYTKKNPFYFQLKSLNTQKKRNRYIGIIENRPLVYQRVLPRT